MLDALPEDDGKDPKNDQHDGRNSIFRAIGFSALPFSILGIVSNFSRFRNSGL